MVYMLVFVTTCAYHNLLLEWSGQNKVPRLAILVAWRFDAPGAFKLYLSVSDLLQAK